MYHKEIDIKALSDITTVINHYYNELIHQLENIDVELHNKVLNGEKYLSESNYNIYKNINFYVVNQSWGNTSCGWGGIGGSAMSSAYTYIVENTYLNAVFVYYNGKLAYIAKDDAKLEPYKKNWRLPGRHQCSEKLNIIYKS